MARKAAIVDEDERENAVEVLPLEGADDDDASTQWAEFENLRDQADTGSAGKVIAVYEIPTDANGTPQSNTDSALLFNAPLDTYPQLSAIFDRVKREYMPRGAGRAMIRIQVRSVGQRGVRWQKVFRIVKGSKDDEPIAPNSAAMAEHPGIAALAQALDRQSRMLGEIFQRQQNAPAIDPMQQTERMIAMVTSLSAVLAKPGGPTTPVAASVADQIAGVREVLKLSRELGSLSADDGDKDGSALETLPGILNAGKPYVELMAQLLARAPAAPVPVRRLPPPVPPRQPNPPVAPGHGPGNAAPQSPNTTMGSAAVTPPQGDPMLLQLAKEVSEICDLIEAGKADAEGVAALILEAVPPEYDERFYGIVSADNYLTMLSAVEPRVRKHAEFFATVRARILQEFAEDATPPESAG